MPRPKVEVFADVRALTARFCEVLSGQVSYAIDHRSRATVAFSRPTPEEVFAVVGQTVHLPRGRVSIFQVDERQVSTDDDQRNWKLIKKLLGPQVEVADDHPMPSGESPARNAKTYENILEEHVGRPPRLDFVHLGLGPDGHTASLLPGEKALDVSDHWVTVSKGPKNVRRMTVTFPVLDAARLVVFVVVGKEKADALKRVVDGDLSAPAARIENGNVLFLADTAAAARL